jgi:hypothetical protein
MSCLTQPLFLFFRSPCSAWRQSLYQRGGEACDLAETVRLTSETSVSDLGHGSAHSQFLARSLGADSFLDKLDLCEKLVRTILQLSYHHLPPANAEQAAS